jgi:hypothetical protein
MLYSGYIALAMNGLFKCHSYSNIIIMGSACTARNTPNECTDKEQKKQRSSKFFQASVVTPNDEPSKENTAPNSAKLFAKITQVAGKSKFIFEVTQSPEKIMKVESTPLPVPIPTTEEKQKYPNVIDRQVRACSSHRLIKKSSLSATDLPQISLIEADSNEPAKPIYELRMDQLRKDDILHRTITPSFGKAQPEAELKKTSNASITSFRNANTFIPGNNSPPIPLVAETKKETPTKNFGVISVIDLQGPVISFNFTNSSKKESPNFKTLEACKSDSVINHDSISLRKCSEESKEDVLNNKSLPLSDEGNTVSTFKDNAKEIKDNIRRKRIRISSKSKFNNPKILLRRDNQLISSQTNSDVSRNDSSFFKIERNQSDCRCINGFEKKGSMELPVETPHSTKIGSICKMSDPSPMTNSNPFSKSNIKMNLIAKSDEDLFSPPIIDLEGRTLHRNRSVMLEQTDSIMDGDSASLVY